MNSPEPTEHTLRLLNQARLAELPADAAALVRSLRDEMKGMNRRLRVLDPLSVSGRQRKESFDFVELVRDVFAGHAAQFKRHNVETHIQAVEGRTKVSLYGVRGMFVQIVENLPPELNLLDEPSTGRGKELSAGHSGAPRKPT